MLRLLICFFIFFLCVSPVQAQTPYSVNGIVKDSTGAPAPGVAIRLLSLQDTLSVLSEMDGSYSFGGVRSAEFQIITIGGGYRSFQKHYDFSGSARTMFQVPAIELKIQVNALAEVEVNADPVTVKEDTLEFRASAYKVREGAPVEDVIKKLPGVVVDKDGNITAQGKSVPRIKVNGKDFFGGDVQTATQNLPADIIDNIQIIDDYGDQANLTGLKTGEPEKVININTKRGMNRGNFGRVSAAVGTENRYVGGLMANNFKDERQISIIASANNTNANTFNFGGGGRGGGARGTNFGGGERGGFGGDGITNSQSVGLNYRNKFGQKLSVYGSYSFSRRENDVASATFSQDFNPLNIRTTDRNNKSHTQNFNHRFTWNMEYQIDSFNYVKFSPYASLSASNSVTSGTSAISKPGFYTFNNNSAHQSSSAPAAGGNLMYNHKFRKRGRNINLYTSFDYSSSSRDREVNNNIDEIDSTSGTPVYDNRIVHQISDDDARSMRTNISASYIEPLSKTLFLEASYAWNQSLTYTDRKLYDVDSFTNETTYNDLLSNEFNSSFITNRYGLNLKGQTQKYNYSAGLVVQPSNLQGRNLNKEIKTDYRNFNWIPTARFVYNFERNNSLTLNYGGQSREPSFNQLQPIIDSTNPLNIVIGNANLQAEFVNQLSARYNRFDRESGSTLFANLSYDQTQNRIVNSVVNDGDGNGRTTTYRNTNGFYGLDGNASYSRPFSNRKFTATIGASGSFDNNISYTDNQRNNGRNWTVRPNARFRIDLPDIIDADVNATYSLNRSTTRYTDRMLTTEAKTLSLGINGKNYFFKDLTLGYDYTKSLNYGFGGRTLASPNILSVYLEYRFWKNKTATVRLQGYDLFNQNTGISYSVNGTSVTNSTSNRLGRYALLSFNLRLQKFAGRTPSRRVDSDEREGEFRNGNRQGGDRQNGGRGGNGGGQGGGRGGFGGGRG